MDIKTAVTTINCHQRLTRTCDDHTKETTR